MLATWYNLRKAREAVKAGQLEEAERLLSGKRGAPELRRELARALAQRGEAHLRRDDVQAAWHDLLRAERLGPEPKAERLRQQLVRLGLAELRAILEAGEAGRALELVTSLREDREVRNSELEPLAEAARDWVRAREAADRGEFAPAQQLLERVGRLLPPGQVRLTTYIEAVRQREQNFGPAVAALHQAAHEGRWPEVLPLAEKVLALAPQHAEATRLRSRAWRALEPVTVVDKAARPGVRPATPPTTPDQYLLWLDGVGGFLVCLGERVTFGQATAEATVDIPLFADVSRLHASLTRDAEGYLLEAVRKVLVNGKEVKTALLQPGDRVTLGSACQFQFRQPVPVSASARLDLVSGHRLRLSVDAVLLMADSLVLGPGSQAHVTVPGWEHPVVLFRQKGGLGMRTEGPLLVSGRACKDRCLLEPGVTASGENFSLALEAVARA